MHRRPLTLVPLSPNLECRTSCPNQKDLTKPPLRIVLIKSFPSFAWEPGKSPLKTAPLFTQRGGPKEEPEEGRAYYTVLQRRVAIPVSRLLPYAFAQEGRDIQIVRVEGGRLQFCAAHLIFANFLLLHLSRFRACRWAAAQHTPRQPAGPPTDSGCSPNWPSSASSSSSDSPCSAS